MRRAEDRAIAEFERREMRLVEDFDVRMRKLNMDDGSIPNG